MLWNDFKQMTTREHLAFLDALVRAASEDASGTNPESNVMFQGRPVEVHAKELVPDFLDNAVFRFKPGSLMEQITDAGLALANTQVEWVDSALSIARVAVPILDAKPLANLPI